MSYPRRLPLLFLCPLVILLTLGTAAAYAPRSPALANEIRLPVVLTPAPPRDLPAALVAYGDTFDYWPGAALPEIFTIRPDGTDKTKRTSGSPVTQFASIPAWSPDHQRIAYNLFTRFGGFIDILTVGDVRRADGQFGLAWAGDAAWSPDGRRLAFVGLEYSSDDRDIWIADLDPFSEATNLTPGLPGNDSDPAWSPDGARIVFRHEHDDGSGLRADLAIMSATGGDITILPATGPDAAAPDWSPDGATILYTGDVAEGVRGLFTVPAAGGGPVLLLPGARDGAWSPDGRYIVFVGANGGLYVARADGSDVFLIDPSKDAATPDW